MATQEDPQDRTQYFARLSHRINPSQKLFEVAAEMRNATPLVQKSLSDSLFSGAECDLLENQLLEHHSIVMTSKQIRSKLNAAYYAFEEYCSLMKVGREGLYFDRNTGKVYIPNAYKGFDPIAGKHANIERTHMVAILNFNILKAIFPFVWDNYFKDGSKKRSRSGMLGSSSKRSKKISSSKSLKSSSSLNPSSDVHRQVIDRIRTLFGNGPNKQIPREYVNAAKSHYNEEECAYFLAYNDDEAKADFASKANIEI